MNMSSEREYAEATLVASESFEHLSPAVPLPSRPSGVSVPHDLLVATMNEVGHGLVIVDAESRVLSANRMALRSFDRSRTLTMKRQHLMAESSADAQVLQHALAAACQGRRTMVKLGRGHEATMVAVVPLPRSDAGVLPCALLVLSRREPCESLSLQFFAAMHKLTLAEVSVLEALSRGRAPLQVAAAGRVAVSTVRTHISSMRQKTGAQSITHLLRMVAGLPPLVSMVDASEAQI